MKISRIKNWIASLLLITTISGSAMTVAVPIIAVAEANPGCAQTILSFPVWYRGIVDPSTCEVQAPTAGSLSDFIWHIVLNVIEVGLMLVGYVSVIFILYGGFLFLTSNGDPAGVVKAKTTLTNAIIGLVISIVSVAIVNFVFGIIS